MMSIYALGKNTMKTLGIVGGLGPESTIEYYRSIIALSSIPLMSIVDAPADVARARGLVRTTRIHVERAVTEMLA